VRCRHGLFLLVLLSASPAFYAAQLTLTPAEVDEALRIGQTRIVADRTRFHAPYRILASQPPVDYVDVVTPYRRVALAADERARLGDRSFGQRQAIELLNVAHGQFDFVVELTLHPLNTFVTMPEYDVALVRDRGRLTPTALERRPRFGARVEDVPSSLPTPAGLIPNRGSEPMLGGTLIAQFDGATLDLMGVTEVVVTDGGKELARVKVDLGRLR
jgi:hypothetical protein